MTHDDDRMVPKVHPVTRGVEADDPMELSAEVVPGDPETMLHCLIQEFTWLGYSPDALAAMFRDSEYPVLELLRERFGEEEIRRRAADSLGGWDAVRVTAEFDDEPEPDDDHDELIQLTVRRRD